MTLKDLLLKYEFDTLVPDLILTDKPAKDNLYAFKEAFDELRRMEPGDPHGEEIVVDMEVDTDDDGNEIDRYLYASHCGGDFWEACLAKEVVIKADVTETCALAQILWHMTFWGFTPEDESFWGDMPRNKYEMKAALMNYRQFCNYARIKPKRNPDEHDLLCALPVEGWDECQEREAHCNRTKRMRDARQQRIIECLEQKGKIQCLKDRMLAYAWDYDLADVKYLDHAETACVYDFYSRTSSINDRCEYILTNMKEHFNADLLKDYSDFFFLFELSEQTPFHISEVSLLVEYLYSITDFPEVRWRRTHYALFPETSDDIHLIIVCSR